MTGLELDSSSSRTMRPTRTNDLVLLSTKKWVSASLDRLKTLVDTLENQMCGGAVAGDNNDSIDGHGHDPS
jgi:hypothetical protein